MDLNEEEKAAMQEWINNLATGKESLDDLCETDADGNMFIRLDGHKLCKVSKTKWKLERLNEGE